MEMEHRLGTGFMFQTTVMFLRKLICHGKLGETYNIGGNAEKRNIDVIDIICEILDELYPRKDSRSYKEQIQFVEDRPGHDKKDMP